MKNPTQPCGLQKPNGSNNIEEKSKIQCLCVSKTLYTKLTFRPKQKKKISFQFDTKHVNNLLGPMFIVSSDMTRLTPL